jgi:hypothetical protein
MNPCVSELVTLRIQVATAQATYAEKKERLITSLVKAARTNKNVRLDPPAYKDWLEDTLCEDGELIAEVWTRLRLHYGPDWLRPWFIMRVEGTATAEAFKADDSAAAQSYIARQRRLARYRGKTVSCQTFADSLLQYRAD